MNLGSNGNERQFGSCGSDKLAREDWGKTHQMPQATPAVTGVKASTKGSGTLFNGLMTTSILAAGTTVGAMIVGVLTGLL